MTQLSGYNGRLPAWPRKMPKDPPDHTPPPHRHRHRHRHALSSLAAAADVAALEAALALVIPDERDATFVSRCIVGEGPAHHRAASWGLIVIAAEIARRLGCDAADSSTEEESVTVAMRLPPHLARFDQTFPVTMPLAPLRMVARGEREVQALADALTDGPPHHALANAVLVALYQRILRALEQPPPAPDEERR